MAFRWLFQGASPPERHTSEQSVCGRPLPRSALLSQFGFVSPEASVDTSGLLNLDRASGLQQIVHKLAVIAFAGSRQTPVVVGKLGRHSEPAIAGVPNRRTFLYGSVGVLVRIR